jgi:hypothetical protein
MNLPTCALLAELGWEPINAFLDRQSVILFLDISVPLDLQKMSYNLYVSKVVFATIISRSLVILLNSISFNEMVKYLQTTYEYA